MKKTFWILVAVLVVSVAINVWQWRTKQMPDIKVEHDTVWKDSIIREPLPAETVDIGKTVYLRIPYHEYLPSDTIHDSIDVPVPIVQKRYDDSLYTAWVSGYEPSLDSIRIYQPEIITTVTKKTEKPLPLITVGIQAGAGYGIVNRKPDVYIGVGLQYNIWRK